MSKNIAILKKYFEDQHEAEEEIVEFINQNFDKIVDQNDKPLKVYIEIGGL